MAKKSEELKEVSIEELNEMLGVKPEEELLEVDSPIEETVLDLTTPKKNKEDKTKDTLDFRLELTHKFHKLEAEKVLIKMKKKESGLKLVPIFIPERKMTVYVTEDKKIEDVKEKYKQ